MSGSEIKPSSRRRFVVLDRDGTIIVEKNYLSQVDQVELLPGAAEGLRQMAAMGLGLVVITNQSGVGRGYFDQTRLDLIHQRLNHLLVAEGVKLSGFYFCPHTPADDCMCRKPRPGLLESAARELDFLPGESFVIGDTAADIALGQGAGATTMWVATGHGGQVALDGAAAPDYRVKDLPAAATIIRHLLAEGVNR